MKIFVDTNIFLDVLMEREHFGAALSILQSVHQGIHQGYVADITLLNVDYVARKFGVETTKFLAILTRDFFIIGADNTHFDAALLSNHTDLEDTIQSLLAEQSQCDCVITNDKIFFQGSVPVIDSVSFVRQHP
jgi:predicted nucleic acid-binding protein